MDNQKKRLKPIDLETYNPVEEEESIPRYEEETASELVDQDVYDDVEDGQDNEELKSISGWVSIALSAVSFFLLPFILAIAGIVVGFVARGREAPILGNIAIVIGALSIIVRLLILPLI